MPPWPEVTTAGVAIGVLFGLFGVGGSSFATPVLGLLGVPGVIAVAAPLPATIPAAILGALGYARRHQVDVNIARWSIMGGVPATIVGALLSSWVGGTVLLVVSGVVLALVGIRILLPLTSGSRLAGRPGAEPSSSSPTLRPSASSPGCWPTVGDSCWSRCSSSSSA